LFRVVSHTLAAQAVVLILVRLFTYVHQHRLLSVLCAAIPI
jgi:hypothetical protein